MTPPNVSSWTWINQLGATIESFQYSLRMKVEYVTGQWRYLVGPCPSTPYAIEAILDYSDNRSTAGSGVVALILRDSSTGNAIGLKFQHATTGLTVNVEHMGVGNQADSGDIQRQISPIFVAGLSTRIALRIADDGTTRVFSYNLNPTLNPGVFTTLHSQAHSAYITPDQLGIGGYNSFGSGKFVFTDWMDWKIT
jgi:hypothetical protein